MVLAKDLSLGAANVTCEWGDAPFIHPHLSGILESRCNLDTLRYAAKKTRAKPP